MTDVDDDILMIDEKQDTSESPEEEKFDANAYISTLIKFMKSIDKSTDKEFSELVAKTWSLSSSTNNFYTDSFTMDSGNVSKLNPNMLNPQKRIAGTQRLMYAPPQILNKSGFVIDKSGASSSSAPGGMKKLKKLVPVIDDSIYCTSEQPCAVCHGVSLAGNQVLACRRCRDCYHMACSIPTVSIEEASEPSFKYYCKTCLVSKKVIDSNRSRSPSPAKLDAKRMKMGRDRTTKL